MPPHRRSCDRRGVAAGMRQLATHGGSQAVHGPVPGQYVEGGTHAHGGHLRHCSAPYEGGRRAPAAGPRCPRRASRPLHLSCVESFCFLPARCSAACLSCVPRCLRIHPSPRSLTHHPSPTEAHNCGRSRTSNPATPACRSASAPPLRLRCAFRSGCLSCTRGLACCWETLAALGRACQRAAAVKGGEPAGRSSLPAHVCEPTAAVPCSDCTGC